MKLLAIETSAEACSAALVLDGEITERLEWQPRKHSELILAMMDELLGQSRVKAQELDAIAFGAGPGSFTGVRIAAAVTQGVAFGVDLPVVAVSTLAALAQRHVHEHGVARILPAFDARMGEVYWGAYERNSSGLVEAVFPDEVAAPEGVTLPTGAGWHGVGTGWEAYEGILSPVTKGKVDSITPGGYATAREVALLGAESLKRGEFVSARFARPVYLRENVTHNKAR